MAQHDVDRVVRSLLSSVALREYFTQDPLCVLVVLLVSTDIELTVDEVRALLRMPRTIWGPEAGPLVLS
jgi:hypothetical protein